MYCFPRYRSSAKWDAHCLNKPRLSQEESLRLSKTYMGGVGGPAGPLTVIVSDGFPGGAGSDFARKIVSLHERTAGRAVRPPEGGVYAD